MKYLVSILVILIMIVTSSCRKDFTTVKSFGDLKFSQDTIFLDTVFTNIGSATYNLKVFNKSDKDITIPEIALENGEDSNYRLNVDGIAGKVFEDIDILANDSIFVFIETTIDFSTITDPLYTDKILFDNGNNQQDVDLITLVQDATFIFPERDPITREVDLLTLDGELTELQGRYLTDDELTFTNERPYVIYGYATVPTDKTLIIEAGAIIYFHNESGLIIDEGATLSINGTLEEKVVFEGDRLEHSFSDIPGQWGTIWLRSGSINNEINHTQIKNGTIGLLIENNSTTETNLSIQNTEIYNNTNFGIASKGATIEGSNLVIGDAGQSSFSATLGGTYNFTHCTFANYWNGLRSSPTVSISNSLTTINEESGDITTDTNNLDAANFVNCIIEGNNNIEFLLTNTDSNGVFNYNINNSLIKFRDLNNSFTNTELDFNDITHYQNNILNGDPDFKNTRLNDLIIGENSSAINQATNSIFSIDLLGTDRSVSPDIGAYQHVVFEE